LKKFLLVVVVLAVALTVWGVARKANTPPQVRFAKATRQTISNLLSTNGKVEPIDYIDVRVESPGLVKSVRVRNGDSVRKAGAGGAERAGSRAGTGSGDGARGAGARGDANGGSGWASSGLAEIDAGLNRARNDRAAAERNLESLQRLEQKQAAAAYDVEQARQAVASFDVQIKSLEQRRAALVGKGDLANLERKCGKRKPASSAPGTTLRGTRSRRRWTARFTICRHAPGRI